MAFGSYDDDFDDYGPVPGDVGGAPAPPDPFGAASAGGGLPGGTWGGAMPTAAPDPGEEDGTGGGGGGGGFGGVRFNFPGAPTFNAPQFYAPTLEDAMNEPGYQFRLKSGQQALERSAAARGVLRSGGTLTDILSYGQNFAASEYSNVFDRALRSYGARYQAAKDMFAPSLADYNNRFRAEQARGLAEYQGQFASRGGGGGGYDPYDDALSEWDRMEPQYPGSMGSYPHALPY